MDMDVGMETGMDMDTAHLRLQREEEGDARLVANLRGEVEQRGSPLRDAVDVDNRLLEEDLEHV